MLTITCFFSVLSAGITLAGTLCDADQKIIEAAVAKARELGVNPVPVCEKTDGSKYIPAGYIFLTESGGMVLQNGDMIINVTHCEITAAGVPLHRGEYAVIENNQPTKGKCKIFNDQDF